MAQHIQNSFDPLNDNLFVTNLGNSQAGALWEIRIAKRQHWTLGLRAASLTIYSMQSALSTHQAGERAASRKAAIAQSDLDFLKKSRRLWQFIPLISIRLESKIQELEDERLGQLKSLPKIQLLVRDCEMELAAAIAERDLILAEHPEALELSYLELQTKYSREALMGKLAYFMAARVWASANNLPESVGQLVFEGSESDRLELLVKELQIRHNAIPSLQAAQIASKLATLSQEDLEDLSKHLDVPLLSDAEDREPLLLKLARQILTFSVERQADLIGYLELIDKEKYEPRDRLLNSGNVDRS